MIPMSSSTPPDHLHVWSAGRYLRCGRFDPWAAYAPRVLTPDEIDAVESHLNTALNKPIAAASIPPVGDPHFS